MHFRNIQQGTLLIIVIFAACFFFISPASHIHNNQYDEKDTTTRATRSLTLSAVRENLYHMRQQRQSSHSNDDGGGGVDTKNCARWIVITSIQPLTEAVRTAANLPLWCVVVVADKKSPATIADYYHHERHKLDSLVYLDVETQEQELDYEILKHLPYHSYARKNIGYLYAMAHGARVIYETDDDNQLIRDLSDFLSEEEWLSIYAPSTQTPPVVNPYAHFGQPSIWPRGYPLSAISREDNDTQTEGRVHSWIQQGLANGDPDVDAIFRLTRKPVDVPLTLTFDELAPPVALPAGTFCPYNSQNTLHHKQAFWALLLPVGVSFRVSDIWRSYWAQRLLWQVHGNLVFLPPSVYQERNAHDYSRDFVDELQLYVQAEKFISFLLKWKPDENNFPDQIIQLSWDMATAGFWKEEDARLVQAWCQDLMQLGYEFPSVSQQQPIELGRAVGLPLTTLFQPQFRQTSMMKHFRVLPQHIVPDQDSKERILLFICILAAPSEINLRNIARETYLALIPQLRGRVEYRFFTDFKDESSHHALLREQNTFGDLHISEAGVHCPGGQHCSTSFGLVLEALEWAEEHYDYTYFLRLDLDGYLCLPQLLLDLQQRPTSAYMAGNFACHAYPPERFFRADGAFVLFTADLARAFLYMQPFLLVDTETTFAINFAAFIFPLRVVLEHRLWNGESANVCGSLVFVHRLKTVDRVRETHQLALPRLTSGNISFTPLRNICEEERVSAGKTLVHQHSSLWGDHSMDVRRYWLHDKIKHAEQEEL